jgi:hypothetical protein
MQSAQQPAASAATRTCARKTRNEKRNLLRNNALFSAFLLALFQIFSDCIQPQVAVILEIAKKSDATYHLVIFLRPTPSCTTSCHSSQDADSPDRISGFLPETVKLRASASVGLDRIHGEKGGKDTRRRFTLNNR